MRRHRRESGFSLLEALVALFILAIGALGIFQMAAASSSGTNLSEDHAAAAALAVAKLEQMKNTTFANLASSTAPETLDSSGARGGMFTRSWSVLPLTVAGVPAADLSVTVSWTGGGTVTFNTRRVEAPVVPGFIPGDVAWFPTVSLRSWDQLR